MPEIAVVATTGTAASAVAATAGKSPGNAAEGQTGPFAAVLKQQLDDPAGSAVASPEVIASLAASANPSTPQNVDPAAILPMLMGSAALTASTTTANDQATKKLLKTQDEDNAAADAANVVAAPLAVAPAVATPVAAPAAPAAGTAASTAVTAALPANLAAAPDLAANGTKTGGNGSAEAALIETDAARAAAAPATLIHGATVATATAPVVSHPVNTPVGSHGWAADVGNQLVWMAGNQSSRAELVLTPPQMGKVEISLTISGDHATASFVSANPEVRAALEDAMPRLREVLADAGVTLGQTQVGSESPKQWANEGQSGDNSFTRSTAAISGTAMGGTAGGSTAWAVGGRGLVDVFA